MNTLINRLFTKDQPISSLNEFPSDEKFVFLKYLTDKGNSSTRLHNILKSIEELSFSSETYIAELQLVQNYLEIENYLIYHDARYIGTETKLRDELKLKFPTIFNTEAFGPLYVNDKDQEILLSQNFLKFLLRVFISRDKAVDIATRNLEMLNNSKEIKAQLRFVDQVNLLREIKENSQKVYDELQSSFGKEWVDSVYYQSYTEFSLYYKELKKIKSIQDLLPENTKLHSETTKVDKVEIIETKKQVLDEPVVQVSERTILENILDGYILFNRKGEILDHNRRALEIFGFRDSQLKDHSILNLFPEDIVSDLKQDLENTDPVVPNIIIGSRREAELLESPNSSQDFELTITNNYSEGIDTFTMFLKNISNKNETLKAISEAKVNAERMAKAKATFLSNMSHEIRTPLNVILGLSEIISKGDFSDDELLKQNLEGIDFSARNLLSIVNDILDFSKIEAGKLSIQSIDFNLHKVVANLTNGFAIKAQEKGLVLNTHIDIDIPNIVIGDQYRLNQILTNLIGNAIKFTQKGKVTVAVKMVSENEEDIAIKFQVKDTGIGIEKDKLNNIFDSFYQVEDANSAKIMGTGLGLAITKELIQLQNGILHADSLVGMGSIFEFILPLKKSKLKKISDQSQIFKKTNKKLSGLNVLVAEDNKMNQFYIKQLLAGLEVTVDIAENGAEAVEQFNNSEIDYDLILMDMHMPIMNGIDAISIIRKSNKDSLKKVPIVACSADVFPEARKNAIKAGIDFYLTKPLNEEAVKEVLYWLISDDEFEPNVNLSGDYGDNDANSSRSSNVDINKLKETFDNDQEFISSLLEIFIKETPEEFKSLRHCIEKEFYTRASSLAHKMKSSFMNLGMTLHGHHLQQIEAGILKKETLEDAKKHMEAFSKIYNKTLLEVNLLLIELRQQ